MTIILIVAVFLLLHLLQAAASGSKSEALALTIAGVVAPIIAHVAKGRTSGRVAMLIAVVVSAAIAVVATFIGGDIHNLGELAKNIGLVFGIASVVYKLVTLPTGPATPPSTTGLFGSK